MKKYRILWFLGTSLPRNIENFKLLVNKESFYSDILVCGKHQKNVYKNLALFHNVYDVMADFADKYESIDIKKEETNHISKHIYEYVEYDRRLNRKPFEFINKAVLHHYDFVEQIVSKNRYDFFYGEVGHLITCLLVDIGKQYGMRILWPMMSFWANRFFISTGDMYALQDEIANSYDSARKSGISEDERQWAISYINKFRSSTPKMPHVERQASMQPDLMDDKKNPIIRKLGRVLELIRDHNYYEYNYYSKEIGEVIKGNLMLAVPDKCKYSNPKYEKPVEGEKYILYFLHFEPDLSTLVWAVYFKDQLSFVKKLAFSIPFGYRVYVKEHPLMVNRPRGFYETLRDIPQVRLLSPDESTRDLLMNCALVCTITGTIGWEALLLKKPVIAFGNVFYNCYEGVTALRDWERLSQTINELLNRTNIDEEKKLIEFVASVKMCTYFGDWYKFTLPEYDEKNSKQVSKSFYECMSMMSLNEKRKV